MPAPERGAPDDNRSFGFGAPGFAAAVQERLPEPPASLLEVGCGDGTLAAALAASGYRVTGIDPEAPERPDLVATRLEDYEPPDRFECAVAIRSLHHTDDLELAIDRLAAGLVPGARIVVFEFAAEAVDERARRWQAERGIERPLCGDGLHVTPLREVRAALRDRFAELEAEQAPYFALEFGRADLLAAEEAAIEAGELEPAGAWLVFENPIGG